jgi:hypothetical protein
MRLRTGSHQGPDIPAPDQALRDIHDLLAVQQTAWAEQLARDPAAFAQLEPEVHRTFGQLADRFVASLLAYAASQPGLGEASKKNYPDPSQTPQP